jgi:hypothetical protein
MVLSGIGTDLPARRRPAALDRPGHSRGASAAGAGGGEMTMVSSKAVKDNALFGRIRQSSHCLQEEQLRAAAAVGGSLASYHEIEMHGQDSVLFLCEKKAARPCVSPYLLGERVQSVCGHGTLFVFASESD